MSKVKVIFIPGNGGGTPNDNWFPYLEDGLEKAGARVLNVQFPDAVLARAEFWLPFLEKLGADENTVLVGHSSGAIAAMRFAEDHEILGSVLVGGYVTDLGDAGEKASGYFEKPWDWGAIRKNQRWTIQYSSTDDPFIPIAEARELHERLGAEYHEYTDQGHFGGGGTHKYKFPELLEALKRKLGL